MKPCKHCLNKHMWLLIYVTGPAKINHVSTEKLPIFSVCSIIAYKLFVILFSRFFEGENFHAFHESIAVRENFTLKIFLLQMC